MRVSTMLDSIFGVPKKLSIIFRGQQKNSGMDPPVLKVREYPPWDTDYERLTLTVCHE